MNKKLNVAAVILAGGLILFAANIMAADKAATNNPPDAVSPEVQRKIDGLEYRLSLQIQENKKDIERQKAVLDTEVSGTKTRFDDCNSRFVDFRWFVGFIILLLGGGILGFINLLKYIRSTVDEKISEALKESKLEERIQNKIDMLDTEIKLAIEEISKLKNQAKKDAEDIKKTAEEAKKIMKTVPPEEATPDQKEIVKEATKEITKRPEKEYTANDYFALGYKAKIENNLEEAIINYDKATALNPDFFEAWNNKGVALRRAGRLEDAIAAYNKAIAIKPDYSRAYYNLACFYSLKKEKSKALEYLKTAIDKGYSNLKHIEEDHDLDFIRDMPEYRQIVEKLKGKG